MANIGVFILYRRDHRSEFNVILHVVFPVVSSIALIVVGGVRAGPAGRVADQARRADRARLARRRRGARPAPARSARAARPGWHAPARRSPMSRSRPRPQVPSGTSDPDTGMTFAGERPVALVNGRRQRNRRCECSRTRGRRLRRGAHRAPPGPARGDRRSGGAGGGRRSARRPRRPRRSGRPGGAGRRRRLGGRTARRDRRGRGDDQPHAARRVGGGPVRRARRGQRAGAGSS